MYQLGLGSPQSSVLFILTSCRVRWWSPTAAKTNVLSVGRKMTLMLQLEIILMEKSRSTRSFSRLNHLASYRELTTFTVQGTESLFFEQISSTNRPMLVASKV